jgi:RHS repeat-associated protein
MFTYASSRKRVDSLLNSRNFPSRASDRGRMVEQSRGGGHTQIVYGPGGNKLALMNGQTLAKGLAPLSGEGVAVYTNGPTLSYYRHADWLGSSRLASTPSRTVYYDGAYAPYGENYAEVGTTDRNFTGQNQDTISSGPYPLYDFLYREYHPTWGRWVSPDPAGLGAVDPSNPQSWNRYAYVTNNPLALTDPLGRDLQGGWGPVVPPYAACETCVIDMGWSGWEHPYFGGGGSNPCSIDGIPAPCGLVYGMASSGSLAACSAGIGPFCSGWVSNRQGQMAYATFAPTATNSSNWSLLTPWIADPSLPENQPGYLDALNAQFAYNIEGLEGRGATHDQITNFINANSEKFDEITLDGGNFHFFDPVGFASLFKCPNNRCSNGLDFSHAGDWFHRDTADPYNFPGGTLAHFAVDYLSGNFVWTIIPRH